MFKYFLFLLCIAVAGLSVFIIDQETQEYAPVDVQPARQTSIHATGIVEGATRDVQLRPEIAGRLVAVSVAIGQAIQAGDVVLRLDDQRQRQLVEVNRASLELAQAKLERLINGARPSERNEAKALWNAKQAQLDQAQRTWNRIRALSSQSAISQQEADETEAQVRALTAETIAAKARWEQLESPARADEIREAQAGVAYAEAQLHLTQIELEKCQLRAPSAGCVLDIHAEPGELLRPDATTPAVILADISRLRVRAFVEEIDAPRLKIGLPASIAVDGLPEQRFAGAIEWISPRMSPKEIRSGHANELYDTQVREVLVTLSSAAELMVGLRVDATFDADFSAPDGVLRSAALPAPSPAAPAEGDP